MVQHCSANAAAMSSNPVEVPVSFFFFFYLQLLKLQLPLRPDDHIFIWNLYFCSSHHLQIKKEIRYGWGEENTTEFVLANLKIYLHKIVREKKKTMLSIKRMKMTILYIIYLSHPCVTRMCYFDAICDPVSWYQRIFHTTGSLKNNLNKTRFLVTSLWALYYFLNTHFISKGKFKYMSCTMLCKAWRSKKEANYRFC